MLNIVVPMAGRGARFLEAGYSMPKPLIPVYGIPMIEVVINNLRPTRPHRFLFICQRQHQYEYGIAGILRQLEPAAEVMLLDGLTAGAACTVLAARPQIDNSQPLMIANCDQWVGTLIDDYLAAWDDSGCEGFIMTMEADHPKWSYVRRSAAGQVIDVVEKQVVSHEATVGIYNFVRGSDFVHAADSMILDDERINNEFYVAPTYRRLMGAGGRVETMSVGADRNGMYGLGVPEDLNYFLASGLEPAVKRQQLEKRRRAS